MSRELNVLLRRIHPIVKPIEPTKPSRDLLILVRRVENRHWLEEEVVKIKERLKETRNEVKFIHHASKCEQCMSELQLAVERYMGRNGPWYLDLTNEVEFDDDENEVWESLPEYYRDCPRVSNYRIGSYWTGVSDDTVRFIKDRFEWARRILEEEIRVIRKYLRALKKWDLESPLPPDSYILSAG